MSRMTQVKLFDVFAPQLLGDGHIDTSHGITNSFSTRAVPDEAKCIQEYGSSYQAMKDPALVEPSLKLVDFRAHIRISLEVGYYLIRMEPQYFCSEIHIVERWVANVGS
ncbi:hypothetical protein NHJ13051_007446 [Beauveria bassiana]